MPWNALKTEWTACAAKSAGTSDWQKWEETDGLAYQPPLPWHALVAQLPVVHQLPANLRDEVKETRARLQRLNNVNPEAPQEYEKAAGRFGFLQTQSKDLEEAARDLRKIIVELDTRMESALGSTFDAVSKEFPRFFKLLLPGGRGRGQSHRPGRHAEHGHRGIRLPSGQAPAEFGPAFRRRTFTDGQRPRLCHSARQPDAFLHSR